MKKKEYSFQKNYITVILNRHRASDEGGLERTQNNMELLQFIKDNLIPWNKEYDLSTMEVSRYLACIILIVYTIMIIYCVRLPVKIRGFTRELLIALTTIIESKE